MKIEYGPWFLPATQDALVRQLRIRGNDGIWLESVAVIGPEWRSMNSRERSKVKRQRIQQAKQSLRKLYQIERLMGKV